ncbi:metallophosphatase family protein [Aquibacillus koreensis]|uniref:Phosphoesterase n=1 Tax=Aquibacillus koreensis TaxID=279446 RepID=A0A9X3WRY3_9BACI|nr:metallophosphoesterase family protein [Aquibacillus koreensis]MCT2537903.1 metallophosphatase family protein [Aquibacillus koreensis]MDC3422671.1 metallophosphatase family protein [Aquibacillus koreensis]
MKLAFLSDIHGNAHALDAVLEDITENQVDKIFVLGDLAYRGPEPNRVLQLIQQLDATVIKGNADEWVVRGVNQGEVPDQALEMMNKERDWTVAQLNQADIEYLSNLPTELKFEEQGVAFHAFHATPTSLFDVVLPHTEDTEIEAQLMTAHQADVYLYGHIHKAYTRFINGKTIMNLGSVGLPFDGVTKASYATVDLDGGSIRPTIHKVSYDYEKTINKYHEVNYPNTTLMENIVRNASL